MVSHIMEPKKIVKITKVNLNFVYKNPMFFVNINNCFLSNNESCFCISLGHVTQTTLISVWL